MCSFIESTWNSVQLIVLLEGKLSLLPSLSPNLPTYIYLPRDGEMLIYNDMLLLSGRIYSEYVFNSLLCIFL